MEMDLGVFLPKSITLQVIDTRDYFIKIPTLFQIKLNHIIFIWKLGNFFITLTIDSPKCVQSLHRCTGFVFKGQVFRSKHLFRNMMRFSNQKIQRLQSSSVPGITFVACSAAEYSVTRHLKWCWILTFDLKNVVTGGRRSLDHLVKLLFG